MEIIRINNLDKNHGQKAVIRSLNMSVKKEGVFFIAGPTGSGKTSLLRILAEIDGEYNGEIIRNYNSIGFLPQTNNFLPWLTVEQNIMFPTKLNAHKKLDNRNYIELCSELLTKSGLDELRDYKTKNLSGGQIQKMAICMRLILQPEILLLDEPFHALDPSTKHELFDFIRYIIKEHCTTFIIVSHNLTDISELGDGVFLFKSSPLSIYNYISGSDSNSFLFRIQEELKLN